MKRLFRILFRKEVENIADLIDLAEQRTIDSELEYIDGLMKDTWKKKIRNARESLGRKSRR